MANRTDVYKCSECGMMLEVLVGCDCEECAISCCNGTLELVEANTVDAATEKHVPVIEKTEKGFKVTVGSVAHPMTPEHWIEWIEVIAGNKVYRKFLEPGGEPSAEFCICAEEITAREHCNLHGLWEAS
jgi:superoxide reductase